MVAHQIARRGVRDPLVLDAVRRVPRELFSPPEHHPLAYADTPLPIDAGQTISQPFMVALMTEALGLTGGEKVLEVGTGSGYGAAVLGEIAGTVWTVERIPSLASTAAEALAAAGCHNVHVVVGDGTQGYAPEAPYDGIVVTAGGPVVPEALQEQLRVGGSLVIPVGRSLDEQRLLCIRRTGDAGFVTEDLGSVRFVPLIGEEGF